MKATLKPGLTRHLAYKVSETKSVPHTCAESPVIAAMPKVFATGFMIVLTIGKGRHERFVVMWDKFNATVAAKAKAARVAQVA
jgi:predicted thioesterase